MLQWMQWPSFDESGCFMIWETLWQPDNQPKKNAGKYFCEPFREDAAKLQPKKAASSEIVIGIGIGSPATSYARDQRPYHTRPARPENLL